jgi:hypothetical protein
MMLQLDDDGIQYVKKEKNRLVVIFLKIKPTRVRKILSPERE